jgi:hypothetical protein
MKDRFDNTPKACSLTTAELRGCEATLFAQFEKQQGRRDEGGLMPEIPTQEFQER